MNRDTEIQYWLDAAKRKDAEGNHAAAISFRNLAWLLEHEQTWLEWCASNPTNLRSHCEQKEVTK